jgi:hypothetical protein
MGMFDYIRSSYDLGPQFTKVECQTKDIEEYGIGGTMSNYWIDPAGYLNFIDYGGTADFHMINQSDPDYNDKHAFMNFKWLPNGNHGKVHVHPITKYIEIYPADWKGEWEDWPRCRIHFKYGRLMDFEDVTGQ